MKPIDKLDTTKIKHEPYYYHDVTIFLSDSISKLNQLITSHNKLIKIIDKLDVNLFSKKGKKVGWHYPGGMLIDDVENKKDK